MLNFVMSKSLYIYNYFKAKKCLIKKDFLCAYENFVKAEKYNDKDYSLYIYKGISEFFLKEFESSLYTLQRALLIIESNKKLNKDEKNYLKKYLFGYIIDILKILNKEESLNEYLKIYKKLKFDRKNINKNFFYDYPLKSD